MADLLRQFKAGIFQALAHPTRVAIVESLYDGEMSVGKICESLGIEQANASQHLAILRNKHLVETRKEGNYIFYRLRDPRLADALALLRGYLATHFREIVDLLRQEESVTDIKGLGDAAPAGGPGATANLAATRN